MPQTPGAALRAAVKTERPLIVRSKGRWPASERAPTWYFPKP
jgi:hypothetical protein